MSRPDTDRARKDIRVVDQIKIVGFAGNLRRGLFNRGVIRAAAE
jgi:hypothetical protein